MMPKIKRDALKDANAILGLTETVSWCSLCVHAGPDNECHAIWSDDDEMLREVEAKGKGCPCLCVVDGNYDDNPGLLFLDAGAWALGLGGKYGLLEWVHRAEEAEAEVQKLKAELAAWKNANHYIV